ncbi:conserved hypothetical protein [Ricinus communis]|uniref:Histone acetyltransferase n=1 Tax=Ricinus communis TaxID=3988 RepID=B9RP39_RICCO|nr:conserved hypothetical protein [Ricinus communis]|eukprot:XP_002515508.1 uncharacterized protein LOC8259446 [Ricinus communis]
MPRPGPRPYECVRRAWHSDRHQPVRGSLIQEIFRVVNEVHSPATKKNKEWQEKLPVVVLKAEEIMYSKANSEAEYMDLKTLWERVNDVINTIVRRDESTETGDLLLPCIEAALNLGCTPRRTSRSQRNCNPRCYLTPGTQEPNTLPPAMPTHTTSLQCIPNYLDLIKPAIVNSTHLGSELQNLVCQNISVTSNKFLLATDNGCLSNYNQSFPMENYPMSSLYSVYPLCYGLIPVSSTLEPGKVGVEQNLFSFGDDAAVKFNQPDPQSPLNQHETGCDLSLRLGSLSAAPLPSDKNRQLQDFEDNGHGSFQEGIKFKTQMQHTDDELHFVTRLNTDNSLDSCSSKLSEHASVNGIIKKRKADFGLPVDDQACCWWLKLPCNDLTGKKKSGGL